MRRVFLLLTSILVGVLATLLSGLVEYPILVFNREPTNYFHFYGFPDQWYSLPTSQCETLNQQYHLFASCQGGFILSGFLVDVTFYTLLSIPFIHLATRITGKRPPQ